MRKCFPGLFLLCITAITAYSQGCIPIRNLVGFGQFVLPPGSQSSDRPVNWLMNVNTRYLNSYNTYDGTHVISPSPAQNHVYEVDYTLIKLMDNGWSVGFDMPIISGHRNSAYEHGGPTTTPRYTTSAFGVGDIRFTVYKWLFDVSKPHRGNIQVGLGLKLPTGDYRAQDYFHPDPANPNTTILAPVNSSIQPGDGGTGFTLEVNSFLTVAKGVSLYGNLFYLSNPRDQNGVISRGTPGDAASVQAKLSANSVPDAYTMRAGANIAAGNFTFWLGARKEGTPVHDLIGNNDGIRRAGTSISIEPGVNYRFDRVILYAFVPAPVYRNGEQIVPDKMRSEITGTRIASPGGFANYLVFVGALFKLQ